MRSQSSNLRLDIGNYVKFYNVKFNTYKQIKLHPDDEKLSNFLNKEDISKFDFLTAVFALYLSRIDRTEGCLLNTVLCDGDDSAVDRNTLLKIDYIEDNSFREYLNDVFNHTIDYADDNLSYYSIYDVDNVEDSSIMNGEGSALTLNIHEDSIELVYNSDLFSDVYIKHMAINLECLIENLINDSNQLLKDVDILSDEENSMLSNFNKGESVEVDKNKTLSRAFRENAINNPDAIAVDDGDRKITYAELERSSNSIAHDLKNNYDIGFASNVALMLPRNYHYPEIVLALNKIGACVIPIDLLYPVNRIEYMLEICEARCIITTKEIANSLDFTINIICIEDLKANDDVELDIVGNGDDLAFIMFTSGTTGVPKGVIVLNKQLTLVSYAFKNIFNVSLGDVLGTYLSFSFIGSLLIFVALILGGCSRIFNEKEQKDSLLLIKELKENHINSLILPPGVGIPIFENEDLKLDYIVLAGAKLNELSKKERHTKIVNFYGTTEIILGITKIYDLNDMDGNRVPIGTPISNTWVYILDKNGNQMPIGVPGEICISNEQISPGYYNNPQLTDEVFMDNPHSTCEDNRRMYRTGDIGFYNFDGEIEIVGREDDQISVRGFRIESGEILNIMNCFPEISDVCLDVEYDNLIAYYKTSADLDIETVKDALKAELPYYMIPSLFVELKNIPLNPNGKIDKSALKELFNNDAEVNISDDVLGVVVNAFKEVLHIDNVLIDDDFVSLGGNSLSAMNLQMLLKERLGVNIYSHDIIDLSTPANITNHIKYSLDVHSSIDVNYSFEDLCPLSESQLNVYLDESVNEMGTAYNNPFKIEFNKHYSADEIKSAIGKLLQVHPVLSARVINDDEILSFSFDAKPKIIEGSKNDIKSFIKPFELDKCLSRFLIVENGESNCLYVDFHHLILDGRSANIVLDTLLSILDGNDVDFIDDGVLRQISFEENIPHNYIEDAHEFFDSMLADRDEVNELLPSIEKDEDFEHLDIIDINDDELNSFLNNHSLTHNRLFASVFAYTLSRFTGSSKVLFNLIEDGRGHIDLSKSVGMFVRTLPVLIDCKNQEVSSFLYHSGDLVNSVMKSDLYPFRLLAKEYDLNSDILFQYSHNLFDATLDKKEGDYKVEDLKQDLIGDLSFYIFNVSKNRLGIKILYSNKFSRNFIEHFVESYKLILNGMMAVNNLSDINYTLSSDLNVLDKYNKTEKDLDFSDVLDAFNENLSKYLNNRLVSYNDTSYSYGEGTFIADMLAKKLVELGVGFQDCVPFLVERSELYMFSALGILSIGGVYVPLEDNLPDERIRFILKDTDAKVVIVSDETYERARNLTVENVSLLNISDIVKGDVGTLDNLANVYGDLACILYTSGTTGIPKGVEITRKGILNIVDYYVNEYEMDHNSVFGLFASIGFDVSAIRGICAPLYAGSCLDIIPMDIRLDINKLNNHFIDKNVTHTSLPTQVARMFINEVGNTSLKVLNTGGEKLGDIVYDVDYPVVDSYGPTECSVVICGIEVKDKIDPSSIGHLFRNVKAYVLDNENRRVPIGAVGELCIAGNQVANGYLNREKETREAFVENPFDNDENYSVMYHTGDLVRVLSDGSLGIVGRQDSQVKIRGNRVELAEVESIIREMGHVEEVTVQTINNDGNNELVAYVVSSKKDIFDEVCRFIGKNKPDYMIPSFIVELDNIPLNVNGKVDKYALPEVDITSLQTEYVAPRNEKEKAIVKAFEKIFNREKIGIHDDFVRLGGDSLNAIKLLQYLEDYDITTSDIFKSRTPAAIAENIDAFSLDLDVYSVEGGCPINDAQVNLFAGITVDGNDIYHVPMFMNIPRKYGLENLLDALDEMVRVHPILNMCLSHQYEMGEKKNLYGRIQDNINVLKQLGDSGGDGGIDELVGMLRNKGWNIKRIYEMFRTILRLFKGQYPYLVNGSKPPIDIGYDFSKEVVMNFLKKGLDLYDYLCRFEIIELEDSYLLFGKFHHLISDGISLGIFKRDLQIILDGGSVEVDDSFLRLSAFNQQVKNTDKYIEASDFFDSMFSEIDEAESFTGDMQSKGYDLSSYELECDQELLKSFLDDAGIGENILFTSVFAYSLSRFVSTDNVLFSIIENGRDRFNDYDSIGLYATVLPLLINCKNQSVDSFFEHSSSRIYGALKYDYYPLFLMVQKYGLDITVLFQYVPDWISYDILGGKKGGIFSSEFMEDIIEDIVGNFEDLIAEFIVQVIYDGDNYNLLIVNSNNYSDKMVKEFKDTYESILSYIISADRSSNIISALKNFE